VVPLGDGTELEVSQEVEELFGPADGLAPFRPAIQAVRWGTLGVSVALAYPDAVDDPTTALWWAFALIALNLYRTFRPIESKTSLRLARDVAIETAITTAAVIATGAWSSVFTFCLVTVPIIVGLARGLWALVVVGIQIAAVSIATVVQGDELNIDSSQWMVELALVALIAGYARRILGESELERTRNLSRIGQLADANALLFSLHRVAQSLPASLDTDEVLDATMGRLRDLFEFDGAALLLLDDTDGSWLVARRDRIRLPGRLTTEELPRPLQRAVALRTLVNESNLLASGGPGLSPSLTSGLYSVLVARGAVIGLVSLEHAEVDHFSERDIELLDGFAEPAALAIDNARWFGRLRTVGAEEERSRIARDLHDRIGQSLAYLAFELDRLVKMRQKGDDIGEPLVQLREDVRSVITEVRDTLYDLRTDVSETQSFIDTLEVFVGRVRQRTDLAISVRADDRGRLPIPQERELFRIAQEALVNVERHADASVVTIVWRCDGRSAELFVIDDGVGFTFGRSGRLDSYGIKGMRERAAAIGGKLDVDSTPGQGTRIRCVVTANA
jgi:signal transduction histidine kinase